MAGAGGSPTALPEIGAVTAHVAAPIAHVSHVIVASEGAASRRTGGEQTGVSSGAARRSAAEVAAARLPLEERHARRSPEPSER